MVNKMTVGKPNADEIFSLGFENEGWDVRINALTIPVFTARNTNRAEIAVIRHVDGTYTVVGKSFFYNSDEVLSVVSYIQRIIAGEAP